MQLSKVEQALIKDALIDRATSIFHLASGRRDEAECEKLREHAQKYADLAKKFS